MNSLKSKKFNLNKDNFERMSKITGLSEALLTTYGSELNKRGISSFAVFSSWQQIMGEKLAQNISFQKLVEQKNGKKILYLTASSDASVLEFSYKKKEIFNRVNSFFGYGIVNDIKLVVDPNFIPVSVTKKLIKKIDKNNSKTLDLNEKKALNIEIKDLNEEERLKKALSDLELFINGAKKKDD